MDSQKPLPVRSRIALRSAAQAMDDAATELYLRHNVAGVIAEARVERRIDELRAHAKSLRSIAKAHV